MDSNDELEAEAVAYIREVLAYDKETGEFRWIKPTSRRMKPGEIAGTLFHHSGYRRIHLERRLYQASTLAWVITTGKFPPVGMEMDHKNGVRDDDRFTNLRLCNRRQNMCNRAKKNTSGFRGVCLRADCGGKWQAQIMVNNKCHYLGLFTTPEAASVVYKAAAKRLHGEFAWERSP